MERTYYDTDSLNSVLRTLEGLYGVSSEDFYAAHLSGEGLPQGLTGFNRHVWASFYRDARSHSGRSFAAQAERVLTAAV